jgi:periplasmic copper chaperone A
MPPPVLALVAALGGSITVSGAWARATAPGMDTAAIYFTVTDAGPPDRLLGVTVPGAADAMLHIATHRGAMAGMTMVDSLPLSPGAPLRLQPGGMHVMVTGLGRPWHAGDTIPVVLRFAVAGPVRAMVQVRPLNATTPP